MADHASTRRSRQISLPAAERTDDQQVEQQLRDFDRPDGEQLALAQVDCNALLEEVIELTRARWSDLPQQRGIVIQLRTEFAELPPLTAAAPELRDALTHLVFNAVDAMPNGGTLTLRTRAARNPDARHSVHVEVSDTGSGMDEETRRRCLERLDSTTGARDSGLGLAIVHRVAQRHRAELRIDSAVGAGTTVQLLFAAISQADTGSAMARAPAQRLRILLVDDDPLITRSLREILEQDGHVVTTAGGGQTGIDLFAAAVAAGSPFGLVITDLGMPYVDGRAVASAIKAASPRTPVVMVTGWAKRLLAESDMPPHVDRLLSKPPRLAELRAALASVTAGAARDAPNLACP
jgi:CheY-like chemotaxis protein